MSAWWRDGRLRWYAASTLVALLVTSSMAVAGLFAGMDSAIEKRIEDLYTDDTRVTRDQTGIARPAWFTGGAYNETLAQLGGPNVATPRFESQFILSRRGLVEAYLEEQGQYEVGVPGASGSSRNQYAVGVLVGLPETAPTWDALRSYLVSGSLPNPRAQMASWPPRSSDLASLRFEITAGVVRDDTSFKDIIRRSARVVGVFDTRIDLVDSFSAWTDLASAASLSNAPTPVANAFTVRGPPPNTAHVTQGASAFSAQYVGDMLLLVRVLAQISVTLLLAAPLFLVWNNIQQVLDRQRRELVVCRALGMRHPIPVALALLSMRTIGLGLLVASILVLIMQWVLPSWLAGWDALPVPASFEVDWTFAATLVLLVIVGGVLATFAAWQGHVRQNLASALRSA